MRTENKKSCQRPKTKRKIGFYYLERFVPSISLVFKQMIEEK